MRPVDQPAILSADAGRHHKQRRKACRPQAFGVCATTRLRRKSVFWSTTGRRGSCRTDRLGMAAASRQCSDDAAVLSAGLLNRQELQRSSSSEAAASRETASKRRRKSVIAGFVISHPSKSVLPVQRTVRPWPLGSGYRGGGQAGERHALVTLVDRKSRYLLEWKSHGSDRHRQSTR